MCQGQKGQAVTLGEMVWVITLAKHGRPVFSSAKTLRHVILVEMFSHYIDIIEQNKESTSLDQLQLQSAFCNGTVAMGLV